MSLGAFAGISSIEITFSSPQLAKVLFSPELSAQGALHVQRDQLSILSVLTSTSVSQLLIQYKINVDFASSGYSSSAFLYNRLTSKLSSSVSNGVFIETLRSSSPAYALVNCSMPAYGPLSVFVFSSRSPTPASRSGNAQVSFFEGLPMAGKVFFPIGIIIAGLMIVWIAVYMYREHKRLYKYSSDSFLDQRKFGASPDRMLVIK